MVIYDPVAGEYDRYYRGPRVRLENEALRRIMRVEGRVLDLGCGTGQLLDLFPVRPEDYYGLDVSPMMLEVARRKFSGHRFVLGAMEAPPPGHVFDVVVSLFSFNYSSDLRRTMAGIWWVLRPGGHLYIVAYGPHHPRRPSSYLLAKRGVEAPRILISAASLQELFSDGFEGVLVRGFSYLPELLPRCIVRCLPGELPRLAMMTLGRVIPDRASYLFLEATRGY